jgi:hypothetical protein
MAAAVATTAAACDDGSATSSAPADDGVLQVVPPGKEDNFYSTSAQEYLLSGTTRVQIESQYLNRSADERLARAKALVPFRQTVIGWFLSQYLNDKESEEANAQYGGFKTLTKNGSWEDLNLREVQTGVFEFDFRQEVAGPLDLLSVLPTHADAQGRRVFDLQLGVVSTTEMQRLETNDEWYRQSPWSEFDPSKLDGSRLEKMSLTIESEPRSNDAWFDYARLIDDGVLDLSIHFGWDYHSNYHLKHSQEVYDWLVRRGFSSPVAKYDDLKRDSGPLKKTIQTPKGPVEVRVSLFWGKPGTETDPDTDAGGRVLENDMRDSLAHRDVIVFEGHSGPFYGFALADWRKTDEGDLDDSELPDLDLPADKYQVVFAEGCDTYGMGEGFFLNPAKADRKNLDIITTTSFSNASSAGTVTALLDSFIQTDATGNPVLPRLSELLGKMDGNSSWFSTMYGVHGIDDNPRVHPWAKRENLCGACTKDADCGPVGNHCVGLAGGGRACTFECTADDGCGDGYACQPAQTGGYIRTKVCVNLAGTCAAPAPASKADVRIARVVPRPDKDLNGDGRFSSRDDESVTLVNLGDAPADLTGWALSDSAFVRFKFPAGTTLAPGANLTVYGGGSVQYKASRSLGLNDNGDTARLTDGRGAVVSEISWEYAAKGEVIEP